MSILHKETPSNWTAFLLSDGAKSFSAPYFILQTYCLILILRRYQRQDMRFGNPPCHG